MEVKKFISRSCPVCGENPPSQTEISSEQKAESLDFDVLTQHWNGFFKEKIIFSYARCGNCGLLYCPTFFHADQLTQLYSQMPPNMVEVPQQALRDTQYGYFKFLKKCSPLTGGFIEIGPDIGLFYRTLCPGRTL